MTLNKKAELLGQIGAMLSSQNLSLSLLVYNRDKKGRDEAGQIKSLLAPLPCSIQLVSNQAEWLEEISKAGAILTNHFSVMATSLSLSKKLLTLSATLPYIEGLGHMAGLSLSTAEEISNIRDLAPASWPSLDENDHLLSPAQIIF